MFFSKKDISGPVDWVIAGLGNPGREYEATRHNAGFLALDRLSGRWNIPVKKLKFQSLCGLGRTSFRGQGREQPLHVLLLRPQTYMNRSGEALRDCLNFYRVPAERALVLYDDVSLPLGKLRVRVKGSDGGHNGIKSILYQLQTDVFPRVKIGVGAPDHPDFDMKDWVLGGFSKEEGGLMREAIERACDAVEEILARGAESGMNRYNG